MMSLSQKKTLFNITKLSLKNKKSTINFFPSTPMTIWNIKKKGEKSSMENLKGAFYSFTRN